MEFINYDIKKDLIVVGGGIPGICAAISAARYGLTVALINNRGHLGGNASVESYVNINGALGTDEFNFLSRESGIIEEILLENLYRNSHGGRYIWDGVLLDMVMREKNIHLFQNTHIDKVEMKDKSTILFCSGVQSTTEKRFDFYGEYFLDDTGDGTLGYLSGASFRMGRESKSEFGERLAPDKSDKYVLPSTLNFVARDTGKPVKYIAPDFALDLNKTDVLKYRSIPYNSFYKSHWYYEIGGELDQISDNEEIIQRHRELVYGIWDYVKNSGKYDSANYDLSYVSCIPGKRESRRLMGDYILTELDIINQAEFEDAVCYGGWSIDLHALDGFFSRDLVNRHIYLNGIYQIPYRCCYSENVDNLFLAGRCISTSHIAFGTTRVMATLGLLAQVVGSAAYLCKKNNTTPRGIYEKYLSDLQQLIQRNDVPIIAKSYNSDEDLILKSKIDVSSVKKCELTKSVGCMKLDKNLAIILPVREYIENLYIKVRSEFDIVLNYSVYKPEKKENYNPQSLLFKGNIKISAKKECDWIMLPINQFIKENKIFVEFEAAKGVEIAYTNECLTGVISLKKEKQDNPSIVDVDTLEPKKYIWNRISETFCFRLSNDENIYCGDNINNGYARPYGLPNIWISDDNVNGENITVAFEEEKTINEIDIVFNSNLDFRLLNFVVYDFNTISDIVKDYVIYYKSGDGYKKLLEVNGNYQRFNKLKFDKLKTKELKIEFITTNGSKNISVYAINVF